MGTNAACKHGSIIQPCICAPGTHYVWVDRGCVESEVCSTLLHMTTIWNRTPDLDILSSTPYPLRHILPRVYHTNIKMFIVLFCLQPIRSILPEFGSYEDSGLETVQSKAARQTWWEQSDAMLTIIRKAVDALSKFI